MIFQTTSSVPSQSVCSVMCTLSHRKCQFYVFIAIGSTCHLGNVWTTSNAILADVGSSEIVHSRIPGSVLIFKVDKVSSLQKLSFFPCQVIVQNSILVANNTGYHSEMIA
jgi:hypothetical protein